MAAKPGLGLPGKPGSLYTRPTPALTDYSAMSEVTHGAGPSGPFLPACYSGASGLPVLCLTALLGSLFS